ncbi:Ig-like domain-containing protein [Petrotoga sp. 9PWA.NaAc.5.4]|uniref:Ig-like domain-containing protein n=1 Tax=Petrotoga sp. 9PWA.NaAc.5.4 TaxID=1434328 RepID=UPI000CA8995B|nr:Ig-like domain-containing protein [Petrotoga sp. 9PWA.NaAc.5.4]PNR94743.1 hypothetical protein X924_05625 [Petrotoga sp. 9PWA.NaAc.5.4]
MKIGFKIYSLLGFFVIISSIFYAVNITLISPQNGSNNVDIRSSFRWQVSQGGDFRYNVYISEDENIDQNDLKIQDIFSTFYTGDVLKPNTTYYWKVEAVDTQGNIYSSPVAKFTTRSLRPGDAYIIFFENYKKIIPVALNYVGVTENSLILFNEDKTVNKTINLEENIVNTISDNKNIFVATERTTYIYDKHLNKIELQINDKIKDFAGENVVYSENSIYVLSDDYKIIKQIEFQNIVKALVNNGKLYVLTKNSLLEVDNNFNVSNSFKINQSPQDFIFIENESEHIIVILTNENMVALNLDFQKVAEEKFPLLTRNYQRKLYGYYDKIVLLSNKKSLNFYGTDLSLIKSLTFDENFEFFVPINEKRFVLLGDSIRAFEMDGNLIWSYATLNKLEIISEPLVYDKGLIVGIKDFITRYLVLYDNFDQKHYYYKQSEEKLFYELETVEEPHAEITAPSTPSTPVTVTFEFQDEIFIEEPITPPQQDTTLSEIPLIVEEEPFPPYEPEEPEEPEFIKIFEKPYNEYIYGAKFDGEYFYLYGYEDIHGWDAKIWKVDKFGNIILEKSLQGQDTDFFRDAIITNDASSLQTNIIAVGDTLSYGLNGNAYIVSLTDDGSINYQINYGDIGRDNGIKILQIDEESFAIAGNIFINKKLSDIFVSKYLIDGTRIWTYNFGGNDVEIAIDIKNTQDQGFIVVGATRSFGAGGFDVYILKLDYYGNMKWQYVHGDSYDNIPVGSIQKGKVHYIVYETSSNPRKLGVLEVDELNGFKSSFEYTVNEAGKLLGVSQIEDKYFAYGYKVENNKKIGVIYEINLKDQSFNEVNTYKFDSNFEIMGLIKPDNQDYFYIFGNIENNKRQNICFIKVHEDNFFNRENVDQ